MKLVSDGIALALLPQKLRLNVGVVLIDGFAGVDDALAVVEVDVFRVRLLQKVGENGDEFLLLRGIEAAPMGAQRASRHLVEVEQRVDDFFQPRDQLGLARGSVNTRSVGSLNAL